MEIKNPVNDDLTSDPDKAEALAGKQKAVIVKDNEHAWVVKVRPDNGGTIRGVEVSNFPEHEVAAYKLSEFMGWNIVPETKLIKYNGSTASAQKWVNGRISTAIVPELYVKDRPNWKKTMAHFLSTLDFEDCARIVLMDLITNNTDRHGRNFMRSPGGKVWAIDNSLMFGKMFRYYFNVLHKYMFWSSFPKHLLRDDLERLTPEVLEDLFGSLITREELLDTKMRLKFVKTHDDLSFKTLSNGNVEKNGFPAHADWFNNPLNFADIDVVG